MENLCWLSCAYPVAAFLLYPSMWYLSLFLPFEQHSHHHQNDPICLINSLLMIGVITMGVMVIPCLFASVAILIVGLIGRIIEGDRKIVLATLSPLLLWSAL